VNPERLRLEWISAAEGTRFAEIMSDFVAQLGKLGPLGQGEGIDTVQLKLKLAALGRLVPYVKLVEREKLRLPERTEKAYRAFYESDATDQLFGELIAGKLAVTQILMLLEESPLSAREICERLGLSASEASRHLDDSSRRSLVRYDTDRKCYALAGKARLVVG
jgi:DNA-binding transcriptional ArsR family regulator